VHAFSRYKISTSHRINSVSSCPEGPQLGCTDSVYFVAYSNLHCCRDWSVHYTLYNCIIITLYIHYIIMHSQRVGSMSRWVQDRISSCPGHGRQRIGGRLALSAVCESGPGISGLLFTDTQVHTHMDTHTSTHTNAHLHTHTLTMCIATLGMPAGSLSQ